MKKHFINATLVVLVVASAGVMLVSKGITKVLPPLASEEGAYVDRLFGMHWFVIAFLFALVMGIMLYSLFAFRRKPGEEGDGAYFHGNTPLEIAWTVIPLGIVLYFSALGARYFHEVKTINANEMIVEVTAQQFSWSFYYPDFDITSSELLLPVGRQAVFKITSKDVLHDFWVVEFRMKQDAVPGMVKELRLTPTVIGEYKVRCAEICGTGHANMRAPVRVVSADAFDKWVNGKTAAAAGAEALSGAALKGSQLAQEQGCLTCHTTDGTTSIAPTWQGLYGESVSLADGSSVTADETYLQNSIIDPGSQIVNGFQNIMPPDFGDKLSSDDVNALIAFIQTLK